MTEFGAASEVPDADRAEQAPAVAGGTVAGDVPEADDADVMEQALELPEDDADERP